MNEKPVKISINGITYDAISRDCYNPADARLRDFSRDSTKFGGNSEGDFSEEALKRKEEMRRKFLLVNNKE